ncbi:MAG: TetR/AcrR family transcriptional regulator [Rhodospirillales bacterium]
MSREAWIELALRVLIEEGEEQVKILGLAKRLGVTRGSFYHHFASRQELIDELLQRWRQQNTVGLVHQASLETETLAQAILNVFRCWSSDRHFNPSLDFTVREWARRSTAVRREVTAADEERCAALAALYGRFGYSEEEAAVRARILYLVQLGYFLLEPVVDPEERLLTVREYLLAFGGSDVTESDLEAFADWVRQDSAAFRS